MKLKMIGTVLVAMGLMIGASSIQANAQHMNITGGYNNTGHHPKKIPVLDRRTLGGYNNSGYHPKPRRFVPRAYGGYNTRRLFKGESRGWANVPCGAYMQGGKRCYR